jgi:ornithine cyclodeaminase/alanine dehydrogenase
MIRYLTRDDVAGLSIEGAALADAIEACARAAATGHAINLPKSGVALEDGRLFQSIMAVGTGPGAPAHAATKIVGLAPGNAAQGLPHIAGLIVLQDGATGAPQCVMDASWVTEFRTAALSLVVARLYAREGARSIGFVGCGAQARAHLAVFAEAFPIERVRAFSRRLETAQAFATHARTRGLEAEASDAPADAVRGADIVVTSVPAGSGMSPFLEASWLGEGAFASLVDLGRSWKPQGFEHVEHVLVDDRAQAEQSAAKRPLVPGGPYTADLQDIVAGRAPTRTSASQRAVFVFQGLALADLAAASLVFQVARQRGVGTSLAS